MSVYEAEKMNALEHYLKKAKQTKSVCAVTRRGTGRGHESRESINVLAHPDLAALAHEIERLRAAIHSFEHADTEFRREPANIADLDCAGDLWVEERRKLFLAAKTSSVYQRIPPVPPEAPKDG